MSFLSWAPSLQDYSVSAQVHTVFVRTCIVAHLTIDFCSDCDETNLVPDEDNIGASDTSIKCAGDQLGFASEGSTSLRGVVCYTGTSPGSTAVYSASPGCALSQESRVQTCMDNGLWSGAPAVVVSRGEGQGPACLVGGGW